MKGVFAGMAIGILGLMVWQNPKLLSAAGEQLQSIQSRSQHKVEQPTPKSSPELLKNTPSQAVHSYFNRLNSRDYANAYRYLTPGWGITLADYSNYWKQFDQGSIKIQSMSVKQNGEGAIATVTWQGKRNNKTVSATMTYWLVPAGNTYQIEKAR